MRFITGFILFAFLALPVFAQSSNAQRQRALGDAMATTISSGNSALADFDSRFSGDSQIKIYTDYKRRYESLSKDLEASERKLDFLLRANDRRANIQMEYDNFSGLLKRLQDVKTEYDNWLRTVQ